MPRYPRVHTDRTAFDVAKLSNVTANKAWNTNVLLGRELAPSPVHAP